MLFKRLPIGYLLTGLGLGAAGLALKIVIINVVSVNVCVYFISRLQQWEYDYSHQFYVMILTISIGYGSYVVANLLGQSILMPSIKLTIKHLVLRSSCRIAKVKRVYWTHRHT